MISFLVGFLIYSKRGSWYDFVILEGLIFEINFFEWLCEIYLTALFLLFY